MRSLAVFMLAVCSLPWSPTAFGDALPGGVTGTVYVQGDSTGMWVPLPEAVVVVTASDTDSTPAPDEGMLVVQDAGLSPPIQVMGPGGILRIVSRSSSIHRLHGVYQGGERIFSLALTMPGLEIAKRLTVPGLVRITCDEGGLGLAPAYVLITAHAGWAATDAEGRYLVTGVPPTSREVRALHPQIGSAVDSVVVTPARAAERDFYLIRLDCLSAPAGLTNE